MVARGAERWRYRVCAFRDRAALGLAVGAFVGCGLGGGTLPLVPVGGSEEPGFKMLSPDAQARACGAVVWPYGSRSGGRLVQAAVADMIARNPEADTIRDVHFSWRGVDLLIAHIGCVSVSGDVGRHISTVKLPMLGDHGEHTHHGVDTLQ